MLCFEIFTEGVCVGGGACVNHSGGGCYININLMLCCDSIFRALFTSMTSSFVMASQ